MRFMAERTQASLCPRKPNRRVFALSIRNGDLQVARRQAMFLIHLASVTAIQGDAMAILPELDVGPSGFK